MRSLAVLRDHVDSRAGAISRHGSPWPCRRGCSDCCRSLGAAPVATRPEWERLWIAYRALPPITRRLVRQRVRELALRERDGGRRGDKLICPLLDRREGVCLVYEERPMACRMYGFFAARDGGRWCQQIEEIAECAPDVIWGNLDAVEQDLRSLSEPISMVDWFAEHPEQD